MSKGRVLSISVAVLAAAAAGNYLGSLRVRPPKNAAPVKIDGLRLYAIDDGPRDERPVVLLHGSTGSCWDFEPLLAHLHDRFRVVVPERPGQGWSAQPDSYRLADSADSVYHVLRGLAVERPLLVGHSYGGAVAMRIAADHPGFARGLLLLASAGPGLTFQGRHLEHVIRYGAAVLTVPVVGPFIAWTVVPLLAPLVVEPALRGTFGPDRGRLSDGFVRRALKIYSRPGIVLAGVREMSHLREDMAELEWVLPTVCAPTWVVTAELDTNVPSAVGEAIAQAIREAKTRRLAGVAHGFPISRPEETARLIDEFAADVDRAASSGR